MPTCPNCDAESELVYRCSECGADLVDDKDGSEDRRGGSAA